MTGRKRRDGTPSPLRDDPLAHECPVPSCRAVRGFWCRDPFGRRRRRLHAARIDLAVLTGNVHR